MMLVATIFAECLVTGHKSFDLGMRAGVYQQERILKLFAGVEFISAADMPVAYQTMAADNYSIEFEAKRAGEIIRWALKCGFVREAMRDGVAGFEIVTREPMWANVGPKRETALDPVPRPAHAGTAGRSGCRHG